MWCKFGAKRSWPAIIVRGEDLGAPQPIRSGQAWVFWFGDRKISEVKALQF